MRSVLSDASCGETAEASNTKSPAGKSTKCKKRKKHTSGSAAKRRCKHKR